MFLMLRRLCQFQVDANQDLSGTYPANIEIKILLLISCKQ